MLGLNHHIGPLGAEPQTSTLADPHLPLPAALLNRCLQGLGDLEIASAIAAGFPLAMTIVGADEDMNREGGCFFDHASSVARIFQREQPKGF